MERGYPVLSWLCRIPPWYRFLMAVLRVLQPWVARQPHIKTLSLTSCEPGTSVFVYGRRAWPTTSTTGNSVEMANTCVIYSGSQNSHAAIHIRTQSGPPASSTYVRRLENLVVEMQTEMNCQYISGMGNWTIRPSAYT